MEKLGHVRFRFAGHDRGGRVAYRLALDHPGPLEKLATLDIVPTHTMWHSIDAQFAFASGTGRSWRCRRRSPRR
jgi:haloacetate dehalogenase